MAKLDPAPRVYLDSCCFIAWAQGEDSGPAIESWLIAAKRGNAQLLTSPLTFAEARGKGDAQESEERRKRIRQLLQEPYVILVDITRQVGLLSNTIAAQRPKIKGADAIHMACAVFGKAAQFMTLNKRDFVPGDIVRGVQIVEPSKFGGDTLFDA